MDTLLRLLTQRPLIFIHLVAAFGALLIGAFVLARQKGTSSHRVAGWSWVLLMATVVVSSFFIRDHRLPNLFGYTPIHLFSLWVAWRLPRAVMLARRGDIAAHRQAMRRIYVGGCIVTGLLTLLPMRLLGSLLWQQVNTLVA
jgi:uncharacterized membrane protein